MNGSRGRDILGRAKGWLHGVVSLIINAEIIGKALCAVLLPTPWAVKVMPVSLAARILPDSYRRRVMENLETVFGEIYTEGQRREITRRYFGQFFAYIPDVFLGLRMKASDVGKIFVVEGQEYVEEALRQGKGAVVVTAHYFWPVRGFLAMGCRGFPVSCVILHAENIPFSRLQGVFRFVLNRVAKRTGVEWLFPGAAVSRADEKLRKNELVGFTIDAPRFGQVGGTRIPFLGGEVAFPAALIDLAIRSEACLLPAYVIPRKGNPGLGIRIHPPLIPRMQGEAGVRECVEHCGRILESLIREEPEHWWLWKDLKQFWRPL